MGAEPELIVLPDADRLAADVAVRALATLADAQQRRGRAALALTAGSIMEAVWQAIAAAPEHANVDWSRVDVFWADERFVPTSSTDRNDGPANRILFERAPFSAVRQFPMPASDGPHPALDEAAAFYAGVLYGARRPDDPEDVPDFDLLLLGLGPDGHCASLFPGHPGTRVDSTSVIAVRNSPKPPPERTSLTFRALDRAHRTWFVAAGAGKAEAVALAHSGADREQVPSAGPKGQQQTLWLIDAEAAAKLPQ